MRRSSQQQTESVSPREKHIPDDAHRTSICLTAEDRAAIRWISEVRRASKSKRTTSNDILVDALWFFLEQAEGKTRRDIRAMIPVTPAGATLSNKVTEMPRPKGRH